MVCDLSISIHLFAIIKYQFWTPVSRKGKTIGPMWKVTFFFVSGCVVYYQSFPHYLKEPCTSFVYRDWECNGYQ